MKKYRFEVIIVYKLQDNNTTVFVDKLFKSLEKAKQYVESHKGLLRPTPDHRCTSYSVQPLEVKTVTQNYGTRVKFDLIEV